MPRLILHNRADKPNLVAIPSVNKMAAMTTVSISLVKDTLLKIPLL